MAKTNFSFLEIVPDLASMVFVDVGAAPTSKPAFFQNLADRNRATVIGFEPDTAACEKMNARARFGSIFHPVFIGRGGPAKFYETTFGYTSSLYPPNIKLAERFSNLADYVAVKQIFDVQTHRLDDVVGGANIDFLKIDVQGGELDVLLGAERLLARTLLVQTEVEFLPMYENQPLFADVDAHMRARGFQFHTFTNFGKLFYAPVVDPKTPLAGHNQILWSDAVYIPDPARFDTLSHEDLLKLVTLLHDLYQSFDLCLYILGKMQSRGLAAPIEAYMKALGASA